MNTTWFKHTFYTFRFQYIEQCEYINDKVDGLALQWNTVFPITLNKTDLSEKYTSMGMCSN